MTKGVNKVILIGNLGKDPEIRHMPSGSPVAHITVATTEARKDLQSGERQERAEWHYVVCFDRLAEIAGEYLRKGSRIYIEGSLRTRKWQDKNHQDHYTTEIVAHEMQMLDGRRPAEERDEQSNRTHYPPAGSTNAGTATTKPLHHDRLKSSRI